MSLGLSNELQLPEFKIISKKEENGCLVYEVEPVDIVEECPCCGSSKVRRNGYDVRLVRDQPLYDQPVFLRISSPRYQCKDCKWNFTQSYEAVEERAKITLRLKKAVQKRCLDKSFTELTEEFGLSDATIRRITNEYIEEKESLWQYYVPRTLGLVEIRLGRGVRLLCLDMEEGGIVELLEDNSIDTLRTYLKKARADVEYCFVIGFNKNYRSLIQSMFRNALIVIDRYYVESAVLSAIRADIGRKHDNTVRNAILTSESRLTKEQEMIIAGLEHNERLRELHDFKEDILSIYGMDSFAAGAATFDEAKSHVCPKCQNQSLLYKKLREFRKEVLTYIQKKDVLKDHCIQDAERCVSGIQKKGAGYSFKNLRARLLFSPPKASTIKRITKHKQRPPRVPGLYVSEYITSYSWYNKKDEDQFTETVIIYGDYVRIEDIERLAEEN